ncbi:CTD kinase subunit beta [Purpureocillium lavendulum]|uniref:CTD kinase subunit beta n=1 Tax=Purpureocillium lavendulum TaxID=1247861 RepID=A0AB34G456_9HYPO|nr:CTD kinase subunit beta [Purpureocillium lavendulum]
MANIVLIGLLCSLHVATASIVVPISDVEPLPLRMHNAVSTAQELFEKSCPEEVSPTNPYKPPEVLYSSYMDADGSGKPRPVNGTVFPSSDSLVRGIIDAWAQHQHLVLRPDVVWFEILAQLNFYMAKHADELRHLFVDAPGKKEIVVMQPDWPSVVGAFGQEIQKRVKTEWLLDWITPGFTTSTAHDNITATVLTMGLTQRYFDFTGGILCGLRSVELLGERADWARLLGKLDRLPALGEEPAAYARALRPIMTRFVRTWDESPTSAETRAFWGEAVRANRGVSCGTGPHEFRVSGWLTGFLHWRETGNLRVQADEVPTLAEATEPGRRYTVLDDVVYVGESLSELPVGYARAPLKMLDYPRPGVNTMAFVLGGNIGVRREALPTTPASGDGGGGDDARRKGVLAEPLSGWFLYGPAKKDVKTGSDGYGSFDELIGIWRSLGAIWPGGLVYPWDMEEADQQYLRWPGE